MWGEADARTVPLDTDACPKCGRREAVGRMLGDDRRDKAGAIRTYVVPCYCAARGEERTERSRRDA
jgi:hypothetical protein